MAVTEDISEKKRLEMQLIQTVKMSAVGELASGIAHEFNNLLSAITGYTSLAASRENLVQIRNDLRVVEKASYRAVDIISKLLSFSRQDEQMFELTSIDQVVEDTFILIERDFEREGIKIIRNYSKIPPIRMDRGEIQQVILNLAINSKDAMPRGGMISVGTEVEGDYVKVIFSDTGIGILKENLGRIFEPFFTTRGGRGSGKSETSGTGLGLSVVYSIIKRHGGSIEVNSEVGKGTTFTIHLPNIQSLPTEAI